MSIPKPTDWQRWCDDAVGSFRYLRDAGVEMIRLAKMPTTLADGFSGGGPAERVTAESELTPTERAADVRGFGDVETDSVCANLGEMFRSLREASALARRSERTCRMIESRGDQRVGRQETGGGFCRACQRSVSGGVDDRIRSGYCEACYSAWRRWQADTQDPARASNRMAFERWRLAALSAPDDGVACDTTNMHTHA